MQRRALVLSLWAAAVGTACGGGATPVRPTETDSREKFVGTYDITRTVVMETGLGSNTQTDQVKLTIAKASAEKKVSISADDRACIFTGAVTSDTSFTVDPVTCPVRMLTGEDQGCTQVDQYLGGTASITGEAFNYSSNGNLTFSCGSGNPSFTGTFALSANGTKI